LRDFSFLSDGPTPPSVPVAPWQLEQLAAKICLPLVGSPVDAVVFPAFVVVVVVVVVTVAALVGAAAAGASVLAAAPVVAVASATGADVDVVVVELVVVCELPPLLLEQPAAINTAIAPAARIASGLDRLALLSRPSVHTHDGRASLTRRGEIEFLRS
jgi:hypothetical protein